MWRFALISVAAFSAVALGASENIDKVNGSIRIEGSRTVGDLSTVNGSIDVGEGTRAEDLETVNGSIQLKPHVVAGSVETVNGSVSVGADAQVVESAETVNGRITLDKRSQVGGHLETVNGDLVLDEARVDGQLRTVNGDITVGAASRVGGGILIEDTKGWKFGSNKRRAESRDRARRGRRRYAAFRARGQALRQQLRDDRQGRRRDADTLRGRSTLSRPWQNPLHGPHTSSPAAAAPRCPHRPHPPRAMPIHGRCRSSTVIGPRPARGRNGRPAFQR